jgi:hypothetical protein
MSKLLLTTYWSAEDAQTVIAFLDELKEIISRAYETDLHKLYEEIERSANRCHQTSFDFNDNSLF